MSRSIITAAEQDFGQPFAEIVQSLADEGESIQAAAAILGYSSPTALRRHVARMGITFVRGSQSIGAMESRRAATATHARIEACKKASAANPTYRRVMLDGMMDTLTAHCRRRGMSFNTVRNRLYRGMTVEQAFRKTNYSRPAPTAEHKWRSSYDMLP